MRDPAAFRGYQIALVPLAMFFQVGWLTSWVLADAGGIQPNIIFILADDQGWNGTSVQMHPARADSKSDYHATPNLEKLAKAGMRFSQAYAPGPMCTPTRASLQTGKSPAQLHMTNVGRDQSSAGAPRSQKLIPPSFSTTLSLEETTIGEMLGQAGYATAWFGKWHLGDAGPEAHGYDESDGPTGNTDGNLDDPENPKDIYGITQRGLQFMQRNAAKGKPFYLQLWHYAVHGPVQATQESTKAYEAKQVGKTHQNPAFAAMSENLDDSIGMVLAKVKQLGIQDRTYVVYMSDHGAGSNLASNAPLHGGKGSLWEGGLRVPLIIRGPGVKQNTFCSVPVAGWDLFPTFCELVGTTNNMPTGLEGRSLVPLFREGTQPAGAVDRQLVFHFPHYNRGGPQSSIYVDRYKLLKSYETGELKLFDLRSDLGENQNLADQQPARVAAMHETLEIYLNRVGAGIPKPNPDFDPASVAKNNIQQGRPNETVRRRPSPAQRAARAKQIQELQDAVDQKDLEKIGKLIQSMTQAADASPTKSATAPARSPRQRRQQLLTQLREAHQRGDLKEIGRLIAELSARR